MENIKIQVGDTFWNRDSNARGSGGWRQVTIAKETSRSWVLNCGYKIPKNKPFEERFGEYGREYTLYNDQQKEEVIWVNSHRYRLGEKIRDCKDYKLLKEVAALINYQF